MLGLGSEGYKKHDVYEQNLLERLTKEGWE